MIERKKTGIKSVANLGKLPPAAIDLEKYIIGACLEKSDNFLEVAEILKPCMFYQDRHAIIFQLISDMVLNAEPIDMITVSQKLRSVGKLELIGGAFYLTECVDSVVSVAAIEYNSRIIAQKYMQRSLIELSSETINDCYDETKDIFDILDNYEVKRDDIINQSLSSKEVDGEQATRNAIDKIIENSKKPVGKLNGIPTPFTELNKNTSGWQNSNLILMAARPAMGKTAMMLSFVLAAARNGDPVLVFSLEMTTEKLINRLISQMSGVHLSKINAPQNLTDSDWHAIHSATNELFTLPITWDDTAGINILEIASKAKRMKRKKGLKLVAIDYLQLITPINDKINRELQISSISRGLKIMAKTLDVPVLALAQLNRNLESRPGASKRPQMSDLRESGSLEQDADLILFLHRPEVYGILEDDAGLSTAGRAEIIVAKNRDGTPEVIDVGFRGEKTQFYELNPEVIEDFSFLKTPKTDAISDINTSQHVDWDNREANLNFDTFGNDDDETYPF